MKRLSTFALILMTSAAPLAAAPALASPDMPAPAAASRSAPLSEAIYTRAGAVLPRHVDELTLGMSVRPKWIGEDASFWFPRSIWPFAPVTAIGRFIAVRPAGAAPSSINWMAGRRILCSERGLKT